MTTRQDIEEAVQRWGDKPEHHWPRRFTNPKKEHDFAIGVTLLLRRMYPDRWGGAVRPRYDETDGFLGWHGFVAKPRHLWKGDSGIGYPLERFIRDTSEM